jgi:hypothetical protein
MHQVSPPSLVASWQRISTQKLALQINMKASCHFLFNHPGTSEIKNSPGLLTQVKVKVTLRLTASQSVSLGVEPHLGLMARYLAITI